PWSSDRNIFLRVLPVATPSAHKMTTCRLLAARPAASKGWSPARGQGLGVFVKWSPSAERTTLDSALLAMRYTERPARVRELRGATGKATALQRSSCTGDWNSRRGSSQGPSRLGHCWTSAHASPPDA